MNVRGSQEDQPPLNTALTLAIDAWPQSELERLPGLFRAGSPLRLPEASRRDLANILERFRGGPGA